jgi:hypothetical protein
MCEREGLLEAIIAEPQNLEDGLLVEPAVVLEDALAGALEHLAHPITRPSKPPFLQAKRSLTDWDPIPAKLRGCALPKYQK